MKLQNLIHILINRRAGPVAGRILKRDVNIAVRSNGWKRRPRKAVPTSRPALTK